MNPTLRLVRQNIKSGDVVVLRHAATQLKRRRIPIEVVIETAGTGELIEDYPHDDAGPAILLLQHTQAGAIHVVWRIETMTAGPAYLITAYRPNQADWYDGFRRRRTVAD